MAGSVRIDVSDASRTSDARRAARKMAECIGFDESRAEQVAIVVTEACTNLLKHAGGGEILLSHHVTNEAGVLDILAIDRGPGMEDLGVCLRDGYSTGGSPGHGMGAIVRLSDASDFYSAPAKGTVVLARWKAASVPSGRKFDSGIQVGGVNVPKPGQEACGDSWGVVHGKGLTTLLVADGLGHGPEASLASREAVRMLHQHAELAPKALLERVHDALRSTRGGAVAVAQIDPEKRVLAYAGVGNISAHIQTGSRTAQHLVSVNGTAGHQVHALREFQYPWPNRGILVFHSDGLATSTSMDAHPALALRDPTLIAAVLYRDFKRGYDDSTVVIAKAA